MSLLNEDDRTQRHQARRERILKAFQARIDLITQSGLVNFDTFHCKALPSVSVAERVYLPLSPGIYFVLTPSETIFYIGRAKSLRMRWSHHHRLQEFKGILHARIAWFAHEDVNNLPALEAAFIAVFQPQLNGMRVRKLHGMRVRHTPLARIAITHEHVFLNTMIAMKKFFFAEPVLFKSKQAPISYLEREKPSTTLVTLPPNSQLDLFTSPETATASRTVLA